MSSRHPAVLKLKRELDGGRVTTDYATLYKKLRADLLIALHDMDAIVVHNACVLNKNLALTQALFDLCTGDLAHKRWIGWHHDFAWDMPQYQDELHDGMPWALLRTVWSGMRNVVVSEARRDELAKLFNVARDSIDVVFPGVDVPQLLQLTPIVERFANMHQDADLIFLQPSRITRRKNIEFALRTLREVITRSKLDIRLLISGPPGPHNPTNQAYLDGLLSLRQNLDLEKFVHFLSVDPIDGSSHQTNLTDADLGALYRLCDIMFFPSTDEGFGIPILEALTIGRDVVCSDLAPLRASGGNAAQYIDPLGEPSEAAEKILRLISNSPRLLRRRAIMRQSAWQSIVEQEVAPLLA